MSELSAVRSTAGEMGRSTPRVIVPRRWRVATELVVGFVARSPLRRGFLTGQIRSFDALPEGDFRRTSPRFQAENLPRNLALVDWCAEIARE
jgi:aryl-alcohol dehydrogenase-like predicted oxidoreductase